MSALPDFANYPRERLHLQWKRRDVLTSVIAEWRARTNDEGGAIKIRDLGLYPDSLIELLTPVVRPDFKATGDADFRKTVALMDGRRTIQQVAQHLAAATGWEYARALRYARGVFLHLVACRWCVPSR